MRKLKYHVATSLDGFIAREDDSVDFFPPDISPEHVMEYFQSLLSDYDTVLMGRGTYESGLRAGVANPYPHLKQYVVSTTLEKTGDPAVELVRTDPVELVRRLGQEEGKDIWLCGGGKLAGALIDEIDQLIIKSYPVSAGTGVPVFNGAFRPTSFAPVQRREFGNGAQVTWFDRA